MLFFVFKDKVVKEETYLFNNVEVVLVKTDFYKD